MYFPTSFSVSSLKQRYRHDFCIIVELQGPTAASLILVTVSALGAEGCH